MNWTLKLRGVNLHISLSRLEADSNDCGGNITDGSIKVGDRIRTKKGMGTIIGGMITVRLDTPWYAKNGTPQTAQTFNIDKAI